MKTQKLVLKIVYCLAGLLLLASIGINAVQYLQFRKFSENPESHKLSKNEPVSDPKNNSDSVPVKKDQKNKIKKTATAGNVQNSDTSESNELEYHLNAAKEELDMTNDQLSEELAKKEEFKKAYYQPSSRNSDPVYKKIRKEAYTRRLGEDYDPLYNKLDISKEKFDEFKGMLLDKEMELSELSETYSSASTKEEKDKIIQQEKDLYEKYKTKIGDLLGDNKNEIYQSYVDRLTERRRLTDFMNGQSADNRIAEEQMEDLIDSMYTARKAVYDEMGPGTQITSSSDLTEEVIAEISKRMARVNERYVEAGNGIMTREQSEKYKAYLKQQLEMQEASLKMSLYLNDNK